MIQWSLSWVGLREVEVWPDSLVPVILLFGHGGDDDGDGGATFR